MKRTEILTQIIEEQKKVIANINHSVERYAHASDIDEDSTIETEDLSRQAEFKDMQLRYETILKEAQRNLAFLHDEMDSTHSIIENGSIVETENAYIFIGISVPKFKTIEKDIVAVSASAPVYRQMINKKQNDHFEFGNQKYTIIGIM